VLKLKNETEKEIVGEIVGVRPLRLRGLTPYKILG